MTPSMTQSDALTALRALLLAALPTGAEVIKGQTNRVPMPVAKDWCVITPARRVQKSTTVRGYVPPTAPAPAIGTATVELSTELQVQVDVYGPGAAENAQIVVTLFRDLWGADFLAPYGLAPLACDDPAQMPLVAGEQQYIQRWTFVAAMHGNIATTVPTAFADRLITGLTEATHGE